MRDGPAEEGAGAAAADLAAAGRAVGGGGADPRGAGPAEAEGADAHAGAADPGRGHLPRADRLPVEPAAEGVPGRQHGAPAVPALGGARGGLGVAGGGRGAREGAKGGDQVGPNPTDRGKPGVKKSRLVEGVGGPTA